jgi:ribosomal protein S18 acetylase RimI-like enzyme
MRPDMKIDIRTATEKDLDILLDVRRQALRAYVPEMWGRSDETRRHIYLVDCLDAAVIQIIQGDGVGIGMLAVEERADEYFIENVVLLPAYQNRGIGTRLVSDVLREAREKGLPVRLEVLKVNPAYRLYERLGFMVTEETSTHFVMGYAI